MRARGRRGAARWWFLAALAVLLLLAAGSCFMSGALGGADAIDPSRLAKAETGDIARSVVATGKIEPLTKVQVKSKASGIVQKLAVDYGDRVTAGQLLAELDKEELQARVGEARAALQASQAALQAARAAHERDAIEAEGPDIPYLQSAAERANRLHEDGIVSISVLEDAEKEWRLALNKQAAALRSVAVMRAEIARAEANVAQSRAALDRAENDLRYSTLLSPMDALVLSRDVEVGDAVSSILVLGSDATLIYTLGDVSSVYVLGKVDESDIGKVYLGQPARIVVESFKDEPFTGEVTKISPYGAERDNVITFEVRVSIRNPGGALKANMSANAEIILEERKGVTLIPEGAVVSEKGGKTTVQVPDPAAEGGVRAVEVTLGLRNGIKAEVTAGLAPGDAVVLQ